MPCLTLWPAPKCGWNGDCTEALISNQTSSFCECRNGFSQSLELNFFIERDELSSSICIYNQHAVAGLYTWLVLCVFVHTCLIMYKVRTKKQLKKRRWWLISAVFVLSFSIRRLFNPKALLGRDFAFSFLLSSFNLICYILVNTFVSKYLNYVANKVALLESHVTFYLRAKKARQGFFFINVIGCFLTHFYWIAIFTDEEVSLILIRSFFAYGVVTYLYQIIFLYLSISELISDMEKILVLDKDASFIKVGRNEGVLDFITNRIPKLKRMRNGMVVIYSIQTLSLGAGVVWDFWLLCWTYFIPLYFILVYAISFIAILSENRPAKKPKAIVRSPTSTNTTYTPAVTNTTARSGTKELSI
uniref:Uncharacterized protein n=1 Tax=Aplanochytrium stocchinoi TaxID=215587 RepID=A0A7S3LRG2_9STRA|mmetsp:Transcript_12899/g.14919  ORF Transcript_12899/g.14919 Transcript_12899/m.14919 type:complete len:359 (-) Transcript_12899:221-1297(-)